jgi:chromosome partitioning protein
MSHVIVFGNEKGGTGKSTTAMHVMTALARMGHRVGILDLDLRQRSLGRYLENRASYLESKSASLAMPIEERMQTPAELGMNAGDEATLTAFENAVINLKSKTDFVIIDCPGAHTLLSEIAHAMADTLVTPINDSFIDFDLLARIDPKTGKIKGPSVYSEMVWKGRQARAEAGAKPIDWIVVRNRLGAQNMVNKRKVGEALTDLSRRIGFRLIPGFADRVIFRELFPKGLTLLDLRDVGEGKFNISNIAARQELRDLIAELSLPDVTPNF